MTDGAPAARQLVRGRGQGVVEVGAAAIAQAADTTLETRPVAGQARQRRQRVRLGVERDRPGEVGVLELVEHRGRGLLGVLHLLPVVQAAHAAVVAHAVGAIDQQEQGDRNPLLLLGGLLAEGDRRYALDGRAPIIERAEGPHPAGQEKSAAEVAHVAFDRVHLAGGQRVAAHVVEHEAVVVEQPPEVGRQPVGPPELDLHVLELQGAGQVRVRVVGDDQGARLACHGQAGGRAMGGGHAIRPGLDFGA